MVIQDDKDEFCLHAASKGTFKDEGETGGWEEGSGVYYVI